MPPTRKEILFQKRDALTTEILARHQYGIHADDFIEMIELIKEQSDLINLMESAILSFKELVGLQDKQRELIAKITQELKDFRGEQADKGEWHHKRP